MRRHRWLQIGCAILFCGASVTASAEDWPRFLGAGGDLTAEANDKTPIEFGAETNVKWKAKLPGKGVSSPIIVGGKVFVTCYTGYGVGGQDEKIEDLKRHLICFDKSTGEQLWLATVDAVQPEDPYSGIGVPAHGYASHTPVSDGEHVFAFFGKSGIYAYDLDGNEIWNQSVGTGSGPQRWGSAASPVLYEDLVIVTAAEESEALVGLNKKNGEEVWRQTAETLQSTWSTPVLVSTKDRTDL
ncbi:MAG: PQQ-binding-like beta-propeller repeat protein, partial [Planctomycetota bacterium]